MRDKSRLNPTGPLGETNLTLEAAYTKARAMETAEKNSKEIQMPQAEAPVAALAVAPAGQEAPVRPLGHVEKQQKPKACQKPNVTAVMSHIQIANVDSIQRCRSFRRRGHIVKAWRTIGQQPGLPRWHPGRQRQDTHCMEASDDESEQEEIVQTVHQLGEKKTKEDPI